MPNERSGADAPASSTAGGGSCRFTMLPPVTSSAVVVAVDVGTTTVALSVTDAARPRLFGPIDFRMTRPDLAGVLAQAQRVLPGAGRVKVGVEAAGHYHRPLTAPSAWPPSGRTSS